MDSRLRAGVWTVVGSIFIAVGSTVAALAAFEDRVSVVLFGFLVFIFGYGVSQLGTYSAWTERDELLGNTSVGWHQALRGGLLVAGWIGIAFGVTLFTQTILRPSLQKAVLSGLTSITGYMAAHVGINGVGVGESVFGPVLSVVQKTPYKGGRSDD
ncbi:MULTISPECIES: hypothetical protein [Haloferax]|uniref:Uncharacterized protein n=1 Tax=Haloferax marinum TaxID=2666143 RepID=A0A6A8GAG0_9EURY|nr:MULTISPECIES: hypothetical protein [Haloferax]KAB1190670.1 hypothetical protein Hfx1150_16665 [Haloferax sp. CBA1150]MRW98200.1 hypothetical protein [Haloferax marinum]